jgi:hypothetical protein
MQFRFLGSGVTRKAARTGRVRDMRRAALEQVRRNSRKQAVLAEGTNTATIDTNSGPRV